MNIEEFNEEIRIMMSDEMIDVELEDKHINLAFKKAKRQFLQKGNAGYKRVFYRLPVDRCKQVYQLPSDVYTVIKAIKPTLAFSVDNEFSLAAYNELFGWKNNREMGDWLSYDFTLQLIEQWRKYLAFEPQIQFDEFTKKIQFLQNPNKDGVWLIELYKNLSDEELRDVLWVQEWALAESKIILGNAYRKFPQIPGPNGMMSLDGQSLVQDGKEMKQQLLEDINNGIDGSQDSAWGVYLG